MAIDLLVPTRCRCGAALTDRQRRHPVVLPVLAPDADAARDSPITFVGTRTVWTCDDVFCALVTPLLCSGGANGEQ